MKVRLTQGLERWFAQASPHLALLAAVAIGLGLCALSAALRIGGLSAATTDGVVREVGYFHALNWSLTYAIVFPITLYFMLAAYQQIPVTLKALTASGMVRRLATMAEGESVSDVMKEVTTGRAILTVFAIVVAFTLSLAEVICSNVIPLLRDRLDPDNPAVDWGEAALLAGKHALGARLANAAFDVLAFALQAVTLATILVFFFWLVDFAARLPKYVAARGLVIVPDLRSRDPRLGFQIFEGILEQLLLASIGTYVMCYLSRLLKLYFTTTKYANVWEFVRDDFVRGFSSDFKRVLSTAPLEPSAATGFFAVLVMMAGFILIIFVGLIVGDVLRRLARDGREAADAWLERENRPLPGANMPSVAESKRKLAEMKLWPMGYPPFNVFFGAVVIGVWSLVSYRLLPLVLAYGLFTVVTKMMSGRAGGPRRTEGNAETKGEEVHA